MMGVVAIALVVGAMQEASPQTSNNAPQDASNGAGGRLALVLELTQEGIAGDPAYLGRRRVAFFEDNGLISYDLTPVPLDDVLSSDDPIAVPLEASIRAAVLRRDFAEIPRFQTFSLAPLDEVDRAIQQSLKTLSVSTNELERQRQLTDLSSRVEKAFDSLDDTLRAYAAQKGLNIERKRGGSEFYRVEVKIDPANATIHFMPYLAFLKCVHTGNEPLERHWNVLKPGLQEMIGRYYYSAEWPPRLGGRETNSFLIRKDTGITFKPPLK